MIPARTMLIAVFAVLAPIVLVGTADAAPRRKMAAVQAKPQMGARVTVATYRIVLRPGARAPVLHATARTRR